MNSKQTEVFERIKPILNDKFGIDETKISEITTETSLINDLGLDSLDHVELVMEIEKEFDINISDDDAENSPNVGQLLDVILNLNAK